MIIPADGSSIREAARILGAGGLVAFPTETVYGLGASLGRVSALERLYRVKGRPADHPVIVHIAQGAELRRYMAGVPEWAQKLAGAFWPGPLTLVGQKCDGVPDLVTGGRPTVGIRVPQHPVALALLREAGALAAPSANRFGSVSPTTAAHVESDIGSEIDLVLDGGPCGVGVESTIILCTEGAPVIVRPGFITPEDVQRVTGFLPAVRLSTRGGTPGALASHYAPRARLLIVPGGQIWERAMSEHGSVGVLTSALPPHGLDSRIIVHRFEATAEDWARHLYSGLRSLDQAGVGVIVTHLLPDEGIGLAVNDRLRRAASRKIDD